jgi:hypothetical protein
LSRQNGFDAFPQGQRIARVGENADWNQRHRIGPCWIW